MFKFGWFSRVCLLCVWLTTGCMLVGVRTSSSVSVTVMPLGPPTPQNVPTVLVHLNGQSLQGALVEYHWVDPQNGNSSSGQTNLAWPPQMPPPLQAQAGQVFSLTTTLAAPPTVWWITEYDGQGALTASSVISPTAAYPLTKPGRWVLYVRGQWDHQRYVGYYFEVSVGP